MKMMDKFSTGENQDSQIESDSELSVEDRNASMAQHGVIVQQDLRSTLNNMERATAAFGLAGFSWNIPGDKVEYYGPWDALLPADKRKSLNIKSLLDILHPEDYGIIYLAFSDLMHGRVYSLEREARIETSENQPEQWILIRATSERNPHGGIQIIHGAVLDITSYKTTERQVAVMTQQDLMTGLPNRQQLLSKIELAQISHLSDSKDRRLELVVLDIDRFRLINESLGETAGDEVLRIVGERLKRQLRRDDTLARLSGDQFAFAILSDLNTDEDKLIRRLDKIRYLISEPINLSVDSGLSEPIVLEANIGIRRATTSEDISAEALLRDALLALREAKSNKSAQYAEFRHELHEELLISVKFEKTIRAALQNDWIDVHYQPVVESETGRPIGFEALARINHPEQGLIPPAVFIPVAEETGLIRELTKVVISKSMAQLATWHKERPAMAHMTMAINLSPVQFEDDDILNDIKSGLQQTGLAGSSIKIEITESLLIKSMRETVKILDAIKGLGVQICIDDFGTGYSSLSYIRNYSFDTLKIDRSFIEHITREPRDAELVRSIVQMGQNVGMKIVVEGVEDEAQQTLLKNLGCHFVQGYLVARPLPALELGSWLDKNIH